MTFNDVIRAAAGYGGVEQQQQPEPDGDLGLGRGGAAAPPPPPSASAELNERLHAAAGLVRSPVELDDLIGDD